MPSSLQERERWNRKYRESPDSWLEPDPFLPLAFSQFVRPRFPAAGHALDLAGGAGRHAIWLAKQGWEVTLIDISETGVENACRNAGPWAPDIRFVVDDLTHFEASQTQFDLVMAFFYLERKIFPQIVRALRPGGMLIYKTYMAAKTGQSCWPEEPGLPSAAWRTRALGGWAQRVALPRSCGGDGDGGDDCDLRRARFCVMSNLKPVGFGQ